jgi:hypothetical protein
VLSVEVICRDEEVAAAMQVQFGAENLAVETIIGPANPPARAVVPSRAQPLALLEDSGPRRSPRNLLNESACRLAMLEKATLRNHGGAWEARRLYRSASQGAA